MFFVEIHLDVVLEVLLMVGLDLELLLFLAFSCFSSLLSCFSSLLSCFSSLLQLLLFLAGTQSTPINRFIQEKN